MAMKRENDRTMLVDNPSTPYWCVIPGGSVPGTKITIEGHPTRNCRRFHVNFVIGELVDRFVADNDIAFHYNPRFDHKCIVRNTRISQKWGDEEWPPHRMPFMRSVKFSLSIIIEEKCYRTIVNNCHFVDYDHRLPHKQANLLNINGDVVIDRIKFESPAIIAPVVSAYKNQEPVPSFIFSESEGSYLSCIESVPFEFVHEDELPDKVSTASPSS